MATGTDSPNLGPGATPQPDWMRYGVGLLAVAVVVAVRVVGRPVLQADIPWILFAPAIMVAAWVGGIGPGLAATALSALAVDYLLLEPYGAVGIANASQAIGYAVFGVSGVLISSMADRARAAQVTRERLLAGTRGERDLLQSIIAGAPAGIALLEGPEHRFMLANPVYKQLARGKGELPGRTVAEVWPEIAQVVVPLLDGVFQSGEAFHATDAPLDVIRDRGPETAYFTFAYEPLRDAAGTVRRILVLARETTGEVQARRQIEELNESLEQRVRRRTAELETVNRELEAFAYSVSHDLRTPLRSIDGFSKLLLEDYSGAVDATGQDYLRRVRAAAQRMGQLIDDILLLSRATRAEMRRDAVDLTAIAQQVTAELRQAQPDRQAEVAVAPGIVANGDPNLLRVVVHNLLGNAWKFTADRPLARISFERALVDGERVYCVRDNGAGFDMAFAGKLFGAFQRLHSDAEFPGTGIGLALVQRIVRRHGGRVWGEGAVGRGATFCFTLGEKE